MMKQLTFGLLVAAILLTTGVSMAADTEAMLKKQQDRYSLTGSPRDAVSRLAKLGGVKIEVDWLALERAEANLTEKVVVKGRNATTGQILELLLAQIAAPRRPLSYYVEDGVVHVTTQSRVLSRRTRNALAPPRRSSRGKAAQVRPAGRAAVAREFKFEGVPLSDVVQYFRDMTGLNFHVNWRSLKNVGVERATPISYQARGVSVATALDLMLKEINADRDKLSSVYWVVDDGMVRIATGEVFRGEMRTVVYDIADLLAVVPNFKAPRVNLDSTTGSNAEAGGDNDNGDLGGLFEPDDDNDDDSGETDVSELRTRQRETIVKMIKESIGEEMWRPEGKGSITILPGRKQMVITQSLLGFKLMRQTLGN
ncbi:MAG: hypothetical protein GVY16_00255 [Planctomycetes bacterium]|jgi:hypothetical protein|nr:hypothetical protein [Phycisphaerae bacterium]NBB94156.1 hypothetical protein [Planctomycetota bacterium]